MKSPSNSKPFSIGIIFGIVSIFLLAASGPIQHVIVDNTPSVTVSGGNGTNVTAQLAGGNASITNFPALLCGNSFSGPNDTTAYAANQVVNNANNVLAVPFTFTNAVLNNGGSAILDQVRIVVSNATFLPSSYLAVYCSTNVTGFSNRMAFSMFYTNASVRRFIIPLNALAVSGSGGDCASVVSPQLGYLYNAAAGDKNAYFHWFLGSAATPVANQPYYIEATFRQLR